MRLVTTAKMKLFVRILASSGLMALTVQGANPALPTPPDASTLIPFKLTPETPGLMSATNLLDKPAGKFGPVVARDGHFYTGDKRIKFWGVNFCFAGCFPTHEQADALAQRLSNLGINAVRFHHMDSQKFPNGIWADEKLDTISPEAQDRLDYFTAALKKQGVYSNLNLHVSRWYTQTHPKEFPSTGKSESYDKIVDLFVPELIAVQKTYARDLLTHVNPYTKTAYVAEPAVCTVEINNENTFFLWGGERTLENLTPYYADLLTKKWNLWLKDKYATHEKLAAAWLKGATPIGENMLQDATFSTLGKWPTSWTLEQHPPAKMTASSSPSTMPASSPVANIKIPAISGTDWHLQFYQPGLKLKKGQFYTLSFTARADKPRTISLGVGMTHEPWDNLGLHTDIKLTVQDQNFRFGFTAVHDDDNARLSFILGQQIGEVQFSNLSLATGGHMAFDPGEDLAKGNIGLHRRSRTATQARSNDWFDFLQHTDEAYFTDMYRFLKNDLKVQAPVTGTIGLGALGTLSQSKLDFVDAHDYWDHPRFPNHDWSNTNWFINNTPMVDNPTGSTFLGLAAIRVAGKPFTVTEYNHSAPNEWQAEGIPMIASFAAAQDWDAVYLFAFTHNNNYQKNRMDGFFDIEGNPLKLPLMPLASRLFLGDAIAPLNSYETITLDRPKLLTEIPEFYFQLDKHLQRLYDLKWSTLLDSQLSVAFSNGFNISLPKPRHTSASIQHTKLTWNATTPGTGCYTAYTNRGAVFVGFASQTPLTLNEPQASTPLVINQLNTPFASMILVPADPTQTLETAPRLLLSIVGRGGNTEMKWDDKRKTVSNQWGKDPVIEGVKATLTLKSSLPLHLYPLDPSGARLTDTPILSQTQTPGTATLTLPGNTLWYEIIRKN